MDERKKQYIEIVQNLAFPVTVVAISAFVGYKVGHKKGYDEGIFDFARMLCKACKIA